MNYAKFAAAWLFLANIAFSETLPSAGHDTLRVGVICGDILKRSASWKAASNVFEWAARRFEYVSDSSLSAIHTAKEQFQKRRLLLSEELKRTMNDTILEMSKRHNDFLYRVYGNKEKKMLGAIVTLNNNIGEPVIIHFKSIIHDVARAESLDVVMDTKDTSIVFCADSSVCGNLKRFTSAMKKSKELVDLNDRVTGVMKDTDTLYRNLRVPPRTLQEFEEIQAILTTAGLPQLRFIPPAFSYDTLNAPASEKYLEDARNKMNVPDSIVCVGSVKRKLPQLFSIPGDTLTPQQMGILKIPKSGLIVRSIEYLNASFPALTDEILLPPGKYRLKVDYYKSSPNEIGVPLGLNIAGSMLSAFLGEETTFTYSLSQPIVVECFIKPKSITRLDYYITGRPKDLQLHLQMPQTPCDMCTVSVSRTYYPNVCEALDTSSIGGKNLYVQCLRLRQGGCAIYDTATSDGILQFLHCKRKEVAESILSSDGYNSGISAKAFFATGIPLFLGGAAAITTAAITGAHGKSEPEILGFGISVSVASVPMLAIAITRQKRKYTENAYLKKKYEIDKIKFEEKKAAQLADIDARIKQIAQTSRQ